MNENKWLILVVDDEPNNLQLMMRILGDNYRLAFATNGVEALEAVQKLNPDIILLDIMMPETDGYEVCRCLKADEETRSIPVIFVTAKGETDDETKGLDLGAIDYITKPVSRPIVRARIKNHLALKIAREEIEKKNRTLEEQNSELLKAAQLREDVERMTRHDLKGPLNAVINYPMMMLESPDFSPTHLRYLKAIEEAGWRMLNMINRSLDIFKMEKGTYILVPDRIDIVRIVNKILTESQPIMNQKKLSKIIRINGKSVNDKDSFPIHAEELLCYSMLANLIKNALEASPIKKQIAIDIFEENDAIVIGIHNKGAVPADIRARFFDKYVTSGKVKGSGLGTYSAKLIAETHGGSIHFDTSDEKGTAVTVRLPQK
ncbi:hybrid sensor histidine kinase/response regulator [Desulfococcaceae bacterium HSG7]|nr:hybrid sensor histidine kinase/response regulator [Desulfococcaceae bacterium HSG9]MDM8554471.1 hybrid sensor histidine kinase/response regulator [Desulfococcaceae bacterium HSG7]